MQYKKYCVFLLPVVMFCHAYSSEGDPLIPQQPVIQSKAETCLSISYMIGCPVMCVIAGVLIAEACLYSDPHACKNFPTHLQNDTDIDTLQRNMWAGPLIFGAAGAVIGTLCTAGIWKFRKVCCTNRNMRIL
jgi:hypothetical protein